MDPLLIAGGVVMVVGVAVVFVMSRGRSLLPETSVDSLLNKLQAPYTVLTGSIIQGEQGMIRLDYTVVSPYGVFVIQEFREAGRVDARLNQEMWRVSGGSGKKLYNPVWGIRKVIGKLERLVGKYPYIPLVVFTRARLTGDRDNSILQVEDLIERLHSFQNVRLSEDEQKKIIGILG